MLKLYLLIIRFNDNSVQLNLPTGTELGKNVGEAECTDDNGLHKSYT